MRDDDQTGENLLLKLQNHLWHNINDLVYSEKKEAENQIPTMWFHIAWRNETFLKTFPRAEVKLNEKEITTESKGSQVFDLKKGMKSPVYQNEIREERKKSQKT